MVSFGKQLKRRSGGKWIGKVNAFCIAVSLAGSLKPCQEHIRSVVFADLGYLNCWQNNAYRVPV